MPKDSTQGCWPLIGNLTRVLDVKHKLYTSYPWSKHYRAEHKTDYFSSNSPHRFADIKNCLWPTLTKQSLQAATQPLLWMFFPLLQNVLSESYTRSILGQETFKSDMSLQLGFTSLVMLRLKETVPLKIQHKIQLTSGITLKPCSYSMYRLRYSRAAYSCSAISHLEKTLFMFSFPFPALFSCWRKQQLRMPAAITLAEFLENTKGKVRKE